MGTGRAWAWVLVGLGATTTGCAGRAAPPAIAATSAEARATTGGGAALDPPARASFARGLAEMARHDRDRDWSEARCKETVDLLLAGQALAAAHHDAGLVQQRCHHDAEARKQFEAALALDPAFHPARTALAVASVAAAGAAAGRSALDHAVAELTRSVRDARFSDARALVALATLQMQRDSQEADGEGRDDLDRARHNLHRALAVDDSIMAAHNQMALLYLAQANRAGLPTVSAAGGKGAGKKAATQALELAALVCSQAITKDPRWAPLHNTAGLIEVELGNLSRAAAEFDEARRLDPSLVEAQMNLAAVNLQVRGFARAEDAYRAVLARRPDDYDARVGLALAIRGQIDAASEPERVKAATKELEEAKRLAPERPEAYFNQAILVQEYGGRTGAPGEALANLARAHGLYEQFLAKAASADHAPAFADARERARERLRDLDQMVEVEKSAVPMP